MIRSATPQDLPAIAALHAENWRDTYRGLLPESFLTAGLGPYMAARWARLPGPGWHLRLVEQGDALAGFAAFCEDKNGMPYLDNLHVAAGAQGAGLGRALMRDMAQILRKRGFDRVHLFVLQGNTATRAAYAALGGEEGAAFDDDLAGNPIHSLPVRWNSLDPLLR